MFDLGEYEDQVRDQDYVDERLGELPEPLREPLRAMLRVDPRERIDAVKAGNQLAKTLREMIE